MAWLCTMTPRRATLAASSQRPTFVAGQGLEVKAAAADAEAAKAEAEQWMEATDLFASPTGGALPLPSAGDKDANGAARMLPRLSFFLKTPDGGGGPDRRISHAFRASQQDQRDVEAWLKSNSPEAQGSGLFAINEAAPEAAAAQQKPEVPAVQSTFISGGLHFDLKPRPFNSSLGPTKAQPPSRLQPSKMPATRSSSLKKPTGYPNASTARTQLPAPAPIGKTTQLPLAPPGRASKRLIKK